MLEQFQLKVACTRDDIDNGLRGQSETCPIALATSRAVKEQLKQEVESIEVDGGIYLTLEDGVYLLEDRESPFIEEFVKRFDVEDYVAPFERELLFYLVEQDRYDDYDSF